MGRSVYLLSLNTTGVATPISLFNTTPAQAGEFLWLDKSTVGYLNASAFIALPVQYSSSNSSLKPVHLLDFPNGTEPSNLQYHPSSGILAFSGAVWTADGNFGNTGKWDKAHEDIRDTAQVYDELFVRHWDTWRVPGRVQTLGVISLEKHKGVWESYASSASNAFINVLNGTGLVS